MIIRMPMFVHIKIFVNTDEEIECKPRFVSLTEHSNTYPLGIIYILLLSLLLPLFESGKKSTFPFTNDDT